MNRPDQSPLRYINESGFPFQIAVQGAVETSNQRTGWNVRYAEHGWVHPDGLGRGFIDLVLQGRNGRQFLVLECKRRQDSEWVFMHTSGEVQDRRHATPWMTIFNGDRIDQHEWAHRHVDPPCPEANFCAVRGQSASDRETLVEKIGAELVLATEALAHAERDFRSTNSPPLRAYVPVIVTTAKLTVANFDRSTVSLTDGKINDARFTVVPWLRYRKQLATRYRALFPQDIGFGDPSYTMENSVFVVSGSSIVKFLSEFELT